MAITQVKKWGKGYWVRIHKGLLERMGIQPETPIEIREEQGSIMLPPLPGQKWSLSDLLAKVTPENTHDEINLTCPITNRVKGDHHY
jgi:antitoxin MazE